MQLGAPFSQLFAEWVPASLRRTALRHFHPVFATERMDLVRPVVGDRDSGHAARPAGAAS